MSSFSTQKPVLQALISSKTRVKLLLKFFLNASNKAYLRGLEEEFGESTNAIRLELNKLQDAGMISAEAEGNKKVFRANTGHPLFSELHSILIKYVGIDQIVDRVLSQLGEVSEVYLTGSFARGLDNQIIDLEIIGKVNAVYLAELVARVQEALTRKIRYVVFSEAEYAALPAAHQQLPRLLIWRK